MSAAEVIPFPAPEPPSGTPLFDDVMDGMPVDTQFEVAFILDELDSASAATIDLAAGNRVIDDIRSLPQYVDGVRPEWLTVIGR